MANENTDKVLAPRKVLIAAVAEKYGMAKVDVAAIVKSVFDGITEMVQAGEQVQFRGFGTFSTKVVQGRTINLQGRTREIPVHKKVKFKATFPV